jgi:cell wall-associated NlpC family hydrolase
VAAPRILLALTASLLALVAGLAPATHAYASPTVQEIEAQIDQLWAQLEPLIEKYDGAQDQLKQNQAQQAKLTQQLAPLQMQVDLGMSRVGAMAAQLYETGPNTRVAAMLEAGTPQAFLDGMSTLDHIAKRQQDTLTATKSQLAEYNRQKAPLDKLVAQEQQQVTDLAAKKKDIQAQLDQLQKLRQQAYGASGAPSGGNLKPVPCPQTYVGGAAGKAVAYACSKIGSRYEFGAAGQTTFDCSGLTMAAYATAGVSLAHFTVTQRQQTTPVSAGNLITGDLVFYGSPAYHVAIYIGQGWVVHAPKAGDWVREAPMSGPGRISGYGRVRA